MTTYEIINLEAREKAAYRLDSLAAKAERKGDLARAAELRRRAEFLRSQE